MSEFKKSLEEALERYVRISDAAKKEKKKE